MLVLSREAGAWEELSEAALGVNPFDVAGTADVLASGTLHGPGGAAEPAPSGCGHMVLARTAADWLEDQLAAAARPLSR